jgi:hypothetical protein
MVLIVFPWYIRQHPTLTLTPSPSSCSPSPPPPTPSVLFPAASLPLYLRASHAGPPRLLPPHLANFIASTQIAISVSHLHFSLLYRSRCEGSRSWRRGEAARWGPIRFAFPPLRLRLRSTPRRRARGPMAAAASSTLHGVGTVASAKPRSAAPGTHASLRETPG